MMLTVVLLLAICGLQDCDAVQTFQEEPRSMEVNPGESALLTCKVYNIRGQCSWQKDGLPQALFADKYEWAGDQRAGDCSIQVLSVAEVDEGEWKCQVTASAFTARDALTSNIARLVVRVAPDPPYLEVSSTPSEAGRNFTVREARPADIKCVVRHGKPPARLSWFIDSTELPASASSPSNSTEPDRPKLWRSESLLQTAYSKADHGRQVRCVALHQAYDTKSLDVTVVLDVQYAPTVTLTATPTGDIEEGIDDVSLTCVADSNPLSNVMWRRDEDLSVFSFQDTVQFTPVMRNDSATYSCEAQNAHGTSPSLAVSLDVKYSPFEMVVGPAPVVTSGLHNRTTLVCRAGGNPTPGYTWLQRAVGAKRGVVRGHNDSLTIDGITYGHQGSYVCVATNKIKGHERRLKSEPIRLDVVGPPEVQRDVVSPEVQVDGGQDALIQMVFCSDPQPRRTTWEWGSNQLETGSGNGRYVAEPISKIQRGSDEVDCYSTRLLVQDAGLIDARSYYFDVENDRGADRYAVSLVVKEPMPLTVGVSVAVACFTVILAAMLIAFYACKTRKWCYDTEGEQSRMLRRPRKVSDTETGREVFKTPKTDSRSDKSQKYRPQPIGVGQHEQNPDKPTRGVAYVVPSLTDAGITTTNPAIVSTLYNANSLHLPPIDRGTRNGRGASNPCSNEGNFQQLGVCFKSYSYGVHSETGDEPSSLLNQSLCGDSQIRAAEIINNADKHIGGNFDQLRTLSSSLRGSNGSCPTKVKKSDSTCRASGTSSSGTLLERFINQGHKVPPKASPKQTSSRRSPVSTNVNEHKSSR